MPFGLTNDAGRPMSPSAATHAQMDSTVSRSLGLLPASPSFTRADILPLESQAHRSSIDHSTLPALPIPPGLTTRHRSSRSPSGARSPPLSDSSDGSIHLPPLAMDSSNSSGSHQASGPPLFDTETIHKILTGDGHIIRPEIHARVDKGFFLSDNDWTCYRRNYFSVGCSYSLQPHPPNNIYLQRHMSGLEPIHAFAVKISAAVDGGGGKPVELVQHTPKRDKGPQMQPSLIKLIPQSANSPYGGGLSSSLVKQTSDYDYGYPHSHMPHQPLNQAVYDRIQFKSATANNGKRRAAQQYYHLVVELYAEVMGAPGEPESSYVLVAKRISAPMVVRGRSPGHYVDERKHNRPTSAGPDGKGSGTQPSTPATAYAPTAGIPADHQYYPKATLPGMGQDHEQYVSSMTSDGEEATYAYYPQALNHSYDTRPSNNGPFSGYYFSGGTHDTFKAYQPMGISCSTYGDSTYGYIPSNGRSRVKNEGTYNSLSWPRDAPRVDYQRNHMPDKLYATESSSQHYPSLPTL
ncbi:hypothetical protein DRE_03345 [Drechslerella stenobrocha 248]|uniref:NDT80 domain-containing protein n=1 Tax=Drechslerella stenobrocha 248 TaxID=1043628 RepID=W7HT03_9PEZI|nr:hypothetical protein DRE_03345 [Drechslerella stenobrocha 248]